MVQTSKHVLIKTCVVLHHYQLTWMTPRGGVNSIPWCIVFQTNTSKIFVTSSLDSTACLERFDGVSSGWHLSCFEPVIACRHSLSHARPSPTIPGLLFVLHAFIMDVALFSFFQHGTRHIIESLNKAGHCINTLFLCGGLSKNELFIQTHADVTGQFHWKSSKGFQVWYCLMINICNIMTAKSLKDGRHCQY